MMGIIRRSGQMTQIYLSADDADNAGFNICETCALYE
jgi:hypothetical protein